MIARSISCSLALILMIHISGCHSDDEKSASLVEANQLHMQALATAEKTEQKIDHIQKHVTNKVLIIKLDSLRNLIVQWEGGLIEVPGFAHDHHHGDHQHKPPLQMTDESMLEYQRKSNEAIDLITTQVEAISK